MPLISAEFLLSRVINPSSLPATLKAASALLARLTRAGLLQIKLPSLSAAAAVDLAPWNALVAALSRHSLSSLAIQTFSIMHRVALPLDSYSLCSALTAAASSASNPINLGKQLHAYASKTGEISSIFVRGALICSYATSDAIQDAHQVFDEFPQRNTVCLNALLNGYVQKKLWMEGLSLFRSIYSLMLDPDAHTISSLLRICAEMSFTRLGTQCHAHSIRRINGFETDAFLLSSLVEMYGKCGLFNKARSVFAISKQWTAGGRRDVVLWTSILNAYARNGQFDDVISAFETMVAEGIRPDEILMLAVLSACASSGNVTKGLVFLEAMVKAHGLVPGHQHYSCVVGMLCRAGELERAWSFVGETSPEEIGAWGAVLCGCSDSGNVKIGEFAFQKAVGLDPGNVGMHVELSNLYARVGMWDELEKLRKTMSEKGMKKEIGRSVFGAT
ncbi:putative pentatricopeptide repeat-containing protein [Platanthera guangdongensis]|uniref:Pentatricopeptide repeat-containing protein n=1 Tax=Platanthera guangdongensis TaxID=2320717 RepID=A0ABR2MKX2_9ASPA